MEDFERIEGHAPDNAARWLLIAKHDVCGFFFEQVLRSYDAKIWKWNPFDVTELDGEETTLDRCILAKENPEKVDAALIVVTPPFSREHDEFRTVSGSELKAFTNVKNVLVKHNIPFVVMLLDETISDVSFSSPLLALKEEEINTSAVWDSNKRFPTGDLTKDEHKKVNKWHEDESIKHVSLLPQIMCSDWQMSSVYDHIQRMMPKAVLDRMNFKTPRIITWKCDRFQWNVPGDHCQGGGEEEKDRWLYAIYGSEKLPDDPKIWMDQRAYALWKEKVLPQRGEEDFDDEAVYETLPEEFLAGVGVF
jgi:hypothetical protein